VPAPAALRVRHSRAFQEGLQALGRQAAAQLQHCIGAQRGAQGLDTIRVLAAPRGSGAGRRVQQQVVEVVEHSGVAFRVGARLHGAHARARQHVCGDGPAERRADAQRRRRVRRARQLAEHQQAAARARQGRHGVLERAAARAGTGGRAGRRRSVRSVWLPRRLPPLRALPRSGV